MKGRISLTQGNTPESECLKNRDTTAYTKRDHKTQPRLGQHHTVVLCSNTAQETFTPQSQEAKPSTSAAAADGESFYQLGSQLLR